MNKIILTHEQAETIYKCLINVPVVGEQAVLNLGMAIQILKNGEEVIEEDGE